MQLKFRHSIVINHVEIRLSIDISFEKVRPNEHSIATQKYSDCKFLSTHVCIKVETWRIPSWCLLNDVVVVNLTIHKINLLRCQSWNAPEIWRLSDIDPIATQQGFASSWSHRAEVDGECAFCMDGSSNQFLLSGWRMNGRVQVHFFLQWFPLDVLVVDVKLHQCCCQFSLYVSSLSDPCFD